ncbi:MAG: dihydroorotate dehydrogenase electron transfer subunit [bacterium]
MRQVRFEPATVVTNEDLGAGNRLLTLGLSGAFPTESILPGQFVMVRGPWSHHPMLPRAFSVLAASPRKLELLIKVVGRGTRLLAALDPGEKVTVLGPLGKPFPSPEPGLRELCVGGGSGIPPLALHALRAQREGHDTTELIYGGRSAADLVLLPRIRAAGLDVYPCTEDGSLGAQGRVTDVLVERLDTSQPSASPARVLACGPTPMLRAVAKLCRDRGVTCLLSLETEMACGLGICRGCMVERRDGEGYLCTCVDGPVFHAEEVVL